MLQGQNRNESEPALVFAANLLCKQLCTAYGPENFPEKTVPARQPEQKRTEVKVDSYTACSASQPKRRSPKRNPVRPLKDSERVPAVLNLTSKAEELDMTLFQRELDAAKDKLIIPRERIAFIKRCVTSVQDGEGKNCQSWKLKKNGEDFDVYHISHGNRSRNGRKATLIYYFEENRPRFLALAEHTGLTPTHYKVLAGHISGNFDLKEEYCFHLEDTRFQ